MHTLQTYIIEDSPVIRDSLIDTLQELGPITVVGVAEDEATAVDWLTSEGRVFDLVIVDLFLRSGSGLGVIRAMRNARRTHKLVVLSNFASPEMRHTCIGLGADRVFDKSTEIEALLQYCVGLAANGSDGAAAASPDDGAPRGERCAEPPR